MSAVGIFFFRPWLGAGSTTFTAHLSKAFELSGFKPMVYRVADRPMPGTLPFGSYEGVSYQNISMAAARAVVKSQPTIMSATAAHPHVRHDVIGALLALGMRAVVHDDGEATQRDWKGLKPVICVRKAVTALIPGSVWLPHPYARQTPPPGAAVVRHRSTRRQRSGVAAVDHRVAVSIARIAASKRPQLILDANRLLPPDDRVELLGMEVPSFAQQLAADYKDVFTRRARPGPAFPFTFADPVRQCRGASFHVDMSWFARDGGGTQYAQLEAADAGCVNVMHKDWFRFDGDMLAGKNAIAVADAVSLARTLMAAPDPAMVQGGYDLLKAHDAAIVAGAYMNELTRGN
jgi:hypothetical protein